jgi:hypothetical protein
MGITKSEDGLYHVKGKTFKLLVGKRQQVGHGTAYKTTGGLTKDDLVHNKWGRWVSKAKHLTEKKNKKLEKAGYIPEKGKFGWNPANRTKKARKSRKN